MNGPTKPPTSLTKRSPADWVVFIAAASAKANVRQQLSSLVWWTFGTSNKAVRDEDPKFREAWTTFANLTHCLDIIEHRPPRDEVHAAMMATGYSDKQATQRLHSYEGGVNLEADRAR